MTASACFRALPGGLVLLVLLATAFEVMATSEHKLDSAAFRQNIGAPLPEVAFRDQHGGEVTLPELAADKPLVLVLSWFECPNLCPMVLDNLAATIGELPFEAGEFRVAVVSIDPEETPETAQALARELARRRGDLTEHWSFLTGGPEAIDRTASAAGFEYAYDRERDSYAHPAGLLVVSPGGTINRYLFGVEPQTPDLRLALLEASEGELGSAADQVVLRCYRFDPDSGRYNLAVMRLV
ncbi:MAG: SCO family protein, partial [Marinobacter sp.]